MVTSQGCAIDPLASNIGKHFGGISTDDSIRSKDPVLTQCTESTEDSLKKESRFPGNFANFRRHR
jgi:hypothetical protein